MKSKIRLQPLVHLVDGSTLGYEALYKRSNSESYPSALNILRSIFTKCENKSDFQLFINMTVEDASNKDFCSSFLKILDDLEVDGSRIVLEINEQTHPEALFNAKKTFSLLRSHNVKIALDDFGTEYSSMSFMSELPIDIVKIDKNFIQNAPFSKKIRTLLKYSINVSHDIGCEVVAEGIETYDQLECVMDTHADIGQGFLFAAPSSIVRKKINPFINLSDFLSYISQSRKPEIHSVAHAFY